MLEEEGESEKIRQTQKMMETKRIVKTAWIVRCHGGLCFLNS